MHSRIIWLSLGVVMAGATTPAFGVQVGFDRSNPLAQHVVGSKWWFDLVVTNPTGMSAQAFQATLQITGPGALTLDVTGSQAIASETGYWVLANSLGANAIDKGTSRYQFGDGPDNAIAEPLQVGDKMARFKFDWSVAGWYTINVDTNVLNTFVQDATFATQALSIANNGLQVYVPEPASALLLVAAVLPFAARRRSR